MVIGFIRVREFTKLKSDAALDDTLPSGSPCIDFCIAGFSLRCIHMKI